MYTITMAITLTAATDDDGRRLDRILRKVLPQLPLSAIHRLLRKGAVLVNGEPTAPSRHIKTGDTITISDILGIDLSSKRPLTEALRHGNHEENSNLSNIQNCLINKARSKTNLTHLVTDIILFEGAGILVLNKPAGLEVHGNGSLEEFVLSYLKPKLPPSLSFRPGPLHRLDKPSSGVIVFSTNLEGARFFSVLLRERKIKKCYLALVEGVIEKAEIWRDELIRDKGRNISFAADPGALMVESVRPSDEFAQTAGKTALTRVSPLAGNDTCTLIQAEIETGRTHQIRVQASARGHSLLGDKKYRGSAPSRGSAVKGRGSPFVHRESFLLHAWRMEFPADVQSAVALPHLIEAPIPDYFRKKIDELFGEDVILSIRRQEK